MEKKEELARELLSGKNGEELRRALERLLSTPEGKALAEKLSRLGQSHG